MIRQAVSGDIPRLAELFRQLHQHHVGIKPETFRMPADWWFTERIRGILEDEENIVLVSEGGGEINGYAVVKVIEVDTAEKHPRRMCYIDCFAVAENARRQGTGTALFDEVKRFAREHDCTSVQLGVAACNTGAVEFYVKMGLTPRTIQMEMKV
ncbi:MAG: GNAT family N-acetyltransferase [Oscillospiraceae bacterium]|nr:GNAT family N-acetyltransferase [Oscillospiraceae bacterium]